MPVVIFVERQKPVEELIRRRDQATTRSLAERKARRNRALGLGG